MEKWHENRLFWGMGTKYEDFILTLWQQRTSTAEKAINAVDVHQSLSSDTSSFEQRTPKGSYGESDRNYHGSKSQDPSNQD